MVLNYDCAVPADPPSPAPTCAPFVMMRRFGHAEPAANAAYRVVSCQAWCDSIFLSWGRCLTRERQVVLPGVCQWRLHRFVLSASRYFKAAFDFQEMKARQGGTTAQPTLAPQHACVVTLAVPPALWELAGGPAATASAVADCLRYLAAGRTSRLLSPNDLCRC